MTQQSLESRIRWMDLLRGVAIVLVLLWHAPAIPALYGYEMPAWLRTANDFLLPFRMPMLMFLSGMLLGRSLRRPLGQYLYGKVALIAWPYFLWAAIHIVQFGGGLALSSPRSWVATGHLWFLSFIGAYYVLAPFLRRLPSWLIAILAFAASVPFEDDLVKAFFYFLGFFYSGHYFAERRQLLVRLARGLPLGLCVLAATALGVWSAIDGQALKYEALTAAGSLAGIVVATRVAEAVPVTPVRVFLEAIGRKSIVYYVSHFAIIIACLAVLRAFGVNQYLVIVSVGFVVAMTSGLTLARWSSKAPVSWLFQLPGYRSRRGSHRAGGPRTNRVANSVTP